MNHVTLIGIDLGKHSFHLHAQDNAGRMVFRKKLSRLQLLRTLAKLPACRVAMEACALANKLARIAWAIAARGGLYQAQPAIV